MTNFTVRVELHHANEDDYDSLHAAMEHQGFVRWIENKDGVKNRLPTAEYNLAAVDIDRKAVLARAQSAANSVKQKPTPWIVVTESAGRTWSGLEEWSD